MKRKGGKRKKDISNSDSSSSENEDSEYKPETLYRYLKAALVCKYRIGSIHRIIYKLENHFRKGVGILRVSLPGTFSFSQNDMTEFFKLYGKIERIVLKQCSSKSTADEAAKIKDGEAIAYVIYADYCSAVLALKVLNSAPEKEKIITARICQTNLLTSEGQLFSEPLIDASMVKDMVIEVERDYEFGEISKGYKYVGTIGLDMTDRYYRLRERILGVDGCNFVRIHYICEKNFKFEFEHEYSHLDDLVLKIISNRSTGMERDVLVLSHSLHKYNQALLYQIVEEYKNSREKLAQIIPRDIHIRKWEKFVVDSQLKFLNN